MSVEKFIFAFNFDYFQQIIKEGEKYKAFDFYCISSDTPFIVANEGIFKYTGSLDSIKFNKLKNKEIKKSRYKELQLANASSPIHVTSSGITVLMQPFTKVLLLLLIMALQLPRES